MKRYIGVDGGGTKTAFAMFDENGKLVASVEGPASNHENMEDSFEEAAGVIMDGIRSLCSKAGVELEDVSYTLMGLAGIDHQYQHDAMCEELDDRGLTNYQVYNDGFIVIKAGVGAGAGIGYNCGTGTCCNSVDSRGEMLQIGGFGELSGDSGNGHWIAQESFRCVYDELCLGKEKTAITSYVAKELGITDREALLASIVRLMGLESEKYIRAFIDAFFAAVNAGDAPALKIMESMAQRGADYICGHINFMQFDSEPVNVVLSGSIHTKLPSDAYISRMKEIAEKQSGRSFRFTKLSVAPVTGCVNWMIEQGL